MIIARRLDWIPTIIKQSKETPIYPILSSTLVFFGIQTLWINRNTNHFNHTKNYPDYRQAIQKSIEFHSLGQSTRSESQFPSTYLGHPLLLTILY